MTGGNNENPFTFLRAATPYVRQFRNKTFVIKLGGDLLADVDARRHLCDQLSLLHHFNINLVIVHGGGPQVDELSDKLGVKSEKVAGRRVTSAEALNVAKMVLAGTQHTDLLADLRMMGLPCVGLSGVDAGLIRAVKRPPTAIVPDGETEARTVDFGLVGDVVGVDSQIVTHLLAGDFVPVIAPLSADDDGNVFNTNADTIAAAIAASLKAEKLFFLIKPAGILDDVKDATSIINHLTVDELRAMESDGRLQAGMRPKAKAILSALEGGVFSAHVISGFREDALLREIFTNEGAGTMIEYEDD